MMTDVDEKIDMERAKNDIIYFAEKILGVKLHWYQKEMLKQIEKYSMVEQTEELNEIFEEMNKSKRIEYQKYETKPLFKIGLALDFPKEITEDEILDEDLNEIVKKIANREDEIDPSFISDCLKKLNKEIIDGLGCPEIFLKEDEEE